MSDEVKIRYNQAKGEYPFTNDDNGDLGLLNHIIRYGSAPGLVPDSEGEFGSFAEVRKYVLEKSDSTPKAKAILDRMFTYATQKITAKDGNKIPLIPLNKPSRAYLKNKTEDVNISVKCPPAYRVIPSVRILDPKGKLLASNIDFVKDPSSNGFVILREFSADVTTGKSVNAGITPLYQGTYELTYKLPQAAKSGTRKSVLAAIANNPDGLGYIFATGREYTIELKNIKPRDQKIPREFRKNCARLTNQTIRLRSSTLKQELVEWNPITNTAKFRITYLRSVNTRNEIDKQKVTTLPLESNDTDELFQAIKIQLAVNNSLFQYEKYTTFGEVGTIAGGPGRGQAREFRITNGLFGQRGAGIRFLLSNEFFLFRSLLIATLQVFSKETSPFKNNPQFQDALLPKETADKLLIAIDETTVPNELGMQLDDPGIDVRSAYESMVIDISTFSVFYGNLAKRKNAISFTDLMVEYFEKLPDIVFRSCIRQGVSPNLWYKSFTNPRTSGAQAGAAASSVGGFVGSRRRPTPTATGRILDNNGFGYMGITSGKQSRGIKANFAKIVDPAPYKRTRNLYRVTEVEYSQDRSGFSTAVIQETNFKSSMKVADARYGELRIKAVPSKVLARSIIEAPTIDPLPMLLLSRNDSPTFSQEHFDPLVVQNLNAVQRSSLGIVNVNWYDVLQSSTAGRESFKFRLGFENGTPFSFSTVDNKHLETQAALNTKGEGVQLKAHSVSFKLYDILSVSPYITDFYFSPKFFGFKDQKEDLFGYAGYYKTNKVNISLAGDKSRFIASVDAVVKLDPSRLAGATTSGNIKTIEKKLEELNKKRRALRRKSRAEFDELDRIKRISKAQGYETEGGEAGGQTSTLAQKFGVRKSEAQIEQEKKTKQTQTELENLDKTIFNEQKKLLVQQQKAQRQAQGGTD
jgi:hypothetical protein